MAALTDVTYGFFACVVEHIRGNIQSPALDLISPATIISDAADNSPDIAVGHADSLSIVQRLDGGKQAGVLLDEIGKLEH